MAKILVIDDEKNIRKMVKLALESAGHAVALAEDGPQGLQLFGAGEGWDLVLLDQRMPGLEGREVVREIKTRDAAARLVMITAFATIELAADVMRAGATDFLRKPFSADTLRGAVQAAIKRPRQTIGATAGEISSDGSPASSSALPVPQISHYLNGFQFWPMLLLPGETEALANFEILRAFQIQSPSRQACRCIAGVTPYVYRQVQAATQNHCNEAVWDTLCRSALSNFLWTQAALPPEILPIYEVTAGQLHDARALAELKPFTDF